MIIYTKPSPEYTRILVEKLTYQSREFSEEAKKSRGFSNDEAACVYQIVSLTLASFALALAETERDYKVNGEPK
jgi:hypothetical protein